MVLEKMIHHANYQSKKQKKIPKFIGVDDVNKLLEMAREIQLIMTPLDYLV